MSERRDIRFARAEDGANIAFWDVGSGPALILGHNITMSHVSLDWEVASFASFYRGLAASHRVIRFDPRNCGMSDRNPELVMTSTAVGTDISAVADACGLDEFALMGVSPMGPPMIEFAASYPKRVTHLILCDADLTVSESRHLPYIKGLAALSEIDDGQLLSSLYLKLAPRAEVDAMAELIAANSSTVSQWAEAVQRWDAEPTVGAVQVSTLVVHSSDSALTDIDSARRLASSLPDSRLVVVDGEFAPYFADQKSELRAIYEFLGTDPSVLEKAWLDADPPPPSTLQTVVFTDLVASTEFISRRGDHEARASMREIETETHDLVTDHGGRLVKNLGDGSLISFHSTQSALKFALEMQKTMNMRPFGMRIGMAAGEPLQENDDLHGTVVVQASRIADLAQSGDILVADSVRQLAAGKGFEFERVAYETRIKGFDQPITIWRVTDSSTRP